MISGQGSTFLNLDEDTRRYMVSASLIVSGLMRYLIVIRLLKQYKITTLLYSLVQIIRIRIPKTRYFIGAGLLQIMGVAFPNVPAAQAIIGNMYNSGACPTETLSDGTINYLPCPDAFGAVLGTQVKWIWKHLEIYCS